MRAWSAGRSFRWPCFPPRLHAFGVVGTGSAASCTEAALNQALSGGGMVTFNCGGGPVTIPITTTKIIALTTTLDGSGQQITLDALGATRHFLTQFSLPAPISLDPAQPDPPQRARRATSGAPFASSSRTRPALHPDRRQRDLREQRVRRGRERRRGRGDLRARGASSTSRTACSPGIGAGNGGAIGQIQARFTIADTVFSGNATNPRVGDGGNGGAIYIDGSNLGALTIQRTIFTGNTATNLGGAIHTYMYGGASAMTIEDATFADNVGHHQRRGHLPHERRPHDHGQHVLGQPRGGPGGRAVGDERGRRHGGGRDQLDLHRQPGHRHPAEQRLGRPRRRDHQQRGVEPRPSRT